MVQAFGQVAEKAFDTFSQIGSYNEEVELAVYDVQGRRRLQRRRRGWNDEKRRSGRFAPGSTGVGLPMGPLPAGVMP